MRIEVGTAFVKRESLRSNSARTLAPGFRENNLRFTTMPASAASELVRQLARARVLHKARAASPGLAAQLDRLAAWQARRLNATYADLARQPRYTQAIEFFRSDLYGPGDYSRRDADLARVVPVMTRVLPQGLLATVARAMELSVLSIELDRRMIEELDQLFALLAFAPTRCLVAGVWSPWPEASRESIAAFLLRWRDSRFALLRSAYDALHQIVLGAWYANPRAWPAIGYTGPPSLEIG